MTERAFKSTSAQFQSLGLDNVIGNKYWALLLHSMLYQNNEPRKFSRIFQVLPLWWLAFMATWHKLESFWKQEPQLGKFPHLIGLWGSPAYILLIENWCESPRSLWVGPPLGCWSWVLYESRISKSWGAIKKAAFLHSLSFSSCLQVSTLHEFLPWPPSSSVMMKVWIQDCDLRVVNWNKVFPSEVVYGHDILSQQ